LGGGFLFFFLRFLINKILINDFISHCLTLLQLKGQETKKKMFLAYYPTKFDLVYPKRKFYDFFIKQIEQQVKEEIVLSPFFQTVLSNEIFFKECLSFELRLYEHIYQIMQQYQHEYPLFFNNTENFRFFDLQKGSRNHIQILLEQLKREKTGFSTAVAQSTGLPITKSIMSLEQYGFFDIAEGKQMTIYWGMPFINDFKNRNPMFYVSQLSEDYRFFRLFKLKLLAKWFFF
jgi:hypothetical protein